MSASETSQPPADPSDTAIKTVRGFGITFSTTAVIALLTIFGILLWKIRSFFHDDALTDEQGNFDALPEFRRNLKRYQAEDVVIPLVAPSRIAARHWTTPLGFLFIDGGHSLDAALADYRGWSSHLLRDGLLVIHDVFTNAADGGQAPHAIWQLAKQSGLFEEVGSFQSLRALKRL